MCLANFSFISVLMEVERRFHLHLFQVLHQLLGVPFFLEPPEEEEEEEEERDKITLDMTVVSLTGFPGSPWDPFSPVGPPTPCIQLVHYRISFINISHTGWPFAPGLPLAPGGP